MITYSFCYSFVAQLSPNGRYGYGSGRIWLDDLKCNNSENGLFDCTYNRWGEHNCDHDEDMGIACGMISKLGPLCGFWSE